MGVGNIRNLDFTYNQEHKVAFDVIDKATTKNKSHSGIELLFGEDTLKGDKTAVLKPLPTGISAPRLLMRIQTKLSQLAGKSYIAIKQE